MLSVCVRRPGRCSACGREAVITSRDRHGQPRCGQCPDRDERDPLAVLAASVTAVDPSLTADAIGAAAHRVFSKPAHLQKLARVIEEDPGQLAGGGARAPIGGVLRLIDELGQAGARDIIRPACGSCLVSDPANHEECAGFGRLRPVNVRTPDGPLCPACRPWEVLTCSICGQHAPCVISKATGKPWCRACKQRWARCARCGTMAPVRGGTAGAPLCSTCAVPGAEFWRSCPGCGQEGRIAPGRCKSCRLRERLLCLLAGPDGTISTGLQGLYDSLAGYERPSTVLTWLGKPAAVVLRELGAGQRPLTHAALDELSDGKPLRHLRTILVATGTLPPPSGTSRPPSPCWTGSPPAASPWQPPARATWRHGSTARSPATAPAPATSSAGCAGTNWPAWTSPPPGGAAPPA